MLNSIKNISHAAFFNIVRNRSHWGPRVINDFEFIYIVKGKGYHKNSDSQVLTVNEDEILLIPPNAEHIFECHTYEASTISVVLIGIFIFIYS